MLVKDAEKIIHSLSDPSKMPGYGYGLPTWACKTGSILRAKIPNSVCASCYACKGHYAFTPAQNAQAKRLQAIEHPLWVQAMIVVLRGKRVRYFRWHDCGDIQNLRHLERIVKVCEGVPDMLFWLPTKEAGILNEYFAKHDWIPENLCIRLSATLVDGEPAPVKNYDGLVQTCTVHSKEWPVGWACPAPDQEGKCGNCRACWDRSYINVSYKKH